MLGIGLIIGLRLVLGSSSSVTESLIGGGGWVGVKGQGGRSSSGVPRRRHDNNYSPSPLHIYYAQSNVKWGGGSVCHGVNGGLKRSKVFP